MVISSVENYKNGQRDDVRKTYYNGKDALYLLCTYIRGKLDGVYRRFYCDGSTQINGQYVQGKKVGTWIEYIIKETIYS